MQLLTEELRAQLPGIYAQAENPDPTIYARFFTPDSNWTWFVTEGQQEEDTFICFGYVKGHCLELGHGDRCHTDRGGREGLRSREGILLNAEHYRDRRLHAFLPKAHRRNGR